MLDTTTNTEVQMLLDTFGAALERGDIAAATDCFQDDCYWRDLVTFTWNIQTSEGKDQIAAMLTAQLAATKPAGWKIAEGETATEDGGVTTAWIEFETEVARGYGLIRQKGGKIWTLLTTMVELKGHEEHKGFTRPLGAKHGAGKHRPTWKEEREAEARELGYTTQPYVVIIGGGQGGIALGARLRQPSARVLTQPRPGNSSRLQRMTVSRPSHWSCSAYWLPSSASLRPSGPSVSSLLGRSGVEMLGSIIPAFKYGLPVDRTRDGSKGKT